MGNVFVEIMNLIEKNTDMPLTAGEELKEYIEKNKKNEAICEIYKLASIARDL